MIITSEQVASELALLGCQSIQLPRDDSVYCPSAGWLEKFGSWFLKQPTSKPIPGKRDCEDMTTAFVKYASDALVAADHISANVGHSIGWGKVTIPAWLADGTENPGLNGIPRGETNGVHMTAIVRCSDNTWYFYEPQTAKKTTIRNALTDGYIGMFAWAWV